MVTGIGSITLNIRPDMQRCTAVQQILNVAEARVRKPPTLRLVGYKDGDEVAYVAMIEETCLGERELYIKTLKKIEGVTEAK